MEIKRIEGTSNRPPSRKSESGGFFRLIFVCVATTVLLPSSSSAATSMQHGSMKAELFHRDHPYSRMRSTQHLGHSGNPQNNGSRSGELARSFVRRRISAKSTNVPLNRSTTWETNVTGAGSAAFEYLMTFSLGTPPQDFVAVADTGSSLSWLQCKPCTSCFNQTSPFFDPTASSTYQSLSCFSDGCSAFVPREVPQNSSCNSSCPYSYPYFDNSYTEGSFSSETIHLKSNDGRNIAVPDFWFGCSHNSYSPSELFDYADGIIGLGPQTISLPSQLGHIFEGKFSYCLVNRSFASVQSSLLLFGINAALDLELQYTALLPNPSDSIQYYYYIGIEGISVGGVAVHYNATAFAFDSQGNGGTMIDSGTIYTYLSPLAFEPLLAAILAKVPSSYHRIPPVSRFYLCYDVTERPNHGDNLPEISLKLANDTSWNLSADIVWELVPDQNAICLSILNQTGRSEPSILGNHQQRDFFVLYDRVENRLGFRKTDCAAHSLWLAV